MMILSRKIVVFVVASLLTMILIYSSTTDAIAKPKHIDMLCRDATPTAPGAVKAEVCCQIINGNISVCNKCQYDANGNDVGGCVNFYPQRQMPGSSSTLPPASAGNFFPSSGNNTGGTTNGQTGPPNRLGTVLPSGNNNNTGTPPALTVTKEHNTASPNVLSSTENSNPNTSTGQGQQSSGHHHHKGEQNGGGTSSTGNTQSGSTNNNPSSGGNNNGKNDNSNGKK
jgi:hypothetical protein